MMTFCTLFDSNYISKGIALYLSIAQYTDDFMLYVMAMDRKCEELLKQMAFSHMVVECIDDNMSPELEEAKNNRSRAEFCWTCGSYITDLFLNKYNLPDVVYLDSDLMFFSSPKPIFDELYQKGASVGLSSHFRPFNASGKYCVQYVYFKNDTEGVKALRWWRDECLKWCFSKMEDGKYGDQKYLEYMPEMFLNVYDIEHRGHGIATWNDMYYKFYDDHLIYKGQEYPYIFFHYSGFNISVEEGLLIVQQNYHVASSIKKHFLKPYVALLKYVYETYLNVKIERVSYLVNYGFIRSVILGVNFYLCRFRWWNYILNKLYMLKYRTRHAPYSESTSK